MVVQTNPGWPRPALTASSSIDGLAASSWTASFSIGSLAASSWTASSSIGGLILDGLVQHWRPRPALAASRPHPGRPRSALAASRPHPGRPRPELVIIVPPLDNRGRCGLFTEGKSLVKSTYKFGKFRIWRLLFIYKWLQNHFCF